MSCTNCNQTNLPPILVSGDPGDPGNNGLDGMFGGVCVHYQFSASTSGANPGSGLLSFDTSIASLATHLYINYTDQVGTDLTDFIDSLNIPNNTVKALIRVTSKTDASLFNIYEVSGVVSGSGFADLSIVYLSGSINPFSAGDDILFCPALSGDSSFNLQTISPDFTTGLDYPASTIGDVYRVLTPGWIGTTSAQEPPNSIRVFKDDMVFCIANTAGGNQGAAGASFFVFSAPRAFVPEDTTNGTSNFILNTNTLTDNTVSSSNRTVIIGNLNVVNNSDTNLVIGVGDGTSGNTVNGANENIVSGNKLTVSNTDDSIVTGTLNNVSNAESTAVSGQNNVVNTADFNLVGGSNHVVNSSSNSNLVIGDQNTVPASENNVVSGYFNSLTSGNNNIIGGFDNRGHVGGTSLIVGTSNIMTASNSTIDFSSIIGGQGVSAVTRSGLYLGSCDSPNSFGGRGAFQTEMFNLSGSVSNVTYPLSHKISLSTNTFGGLNTLVNVPNNSVLFYEANIVIVQTAVGANHTNTSTIGDTVGFMVNGAIRNLGGSLSHIYTKWLDARGNWVPGTGSLPHLRRFISCTDMSQADLYIATPVISTSGTNLAIDLFFPGFQGVMPLSTLTEPLRGEIFPTPLTLTNGIVDAGTYNGPTVTATYRAPLVDVYGGAGLYGGSGLGAIATGTLTPTTIANNLYICSGGTGYSDGNLIFSSGDATGTYTTTGGVITGVTLTSGGSLIYTSVPTISFSNPGSGAIVTAFLTPTTTEDVVVAAGAGGAGYTDVPSAIVYDSGSLACNGGNGGSFRAGGTIKVTQVKF